jgi:hypothetical protein
MQSLAVLTATPLALALPVVGRPLPRPHVVHASVVEAPVAGIDAASARSVAGWGLAGPATARPLALTRQVRAAAFSALGVTWAGGGEYEVLARVRQGGRWTDWHALDADADHGPDTSVETEARAGTAPWFTGPADGYQVRVGVVGGAAPRDVRVALVDPGRSDADGSLGASPTLGSSSADASIGQPAIVTRAQWGADESLRSGSPSYGDTIRMGFVHHTDTSNSYTSSQAAAMVRSVYAYHVRSRGWSDIGYNFLVDKYGRVFEGRYGGVDRPVIGAHTGGFNSNTFGVSLLGTYTTVAPTSGQLAALEKVFAWKLGLHYVNPLARTTLTSAGGTKYASGTRVTFDNVSGHRDAGLTSCPGNQTYSRLGSIRAAIKSYMGASLYGPSVSATSVTYLTTPSVTVRATVPGGQAWKLTVRNHRSGTVLRTLSGTTSSAIAATWDLRSSLGVPATPDTYDLTLTSWNAASTARPFTAAVAVRSPLPSAVSVARTSGTPYAMVDAGRLYGVSAPLAAALRPQPSVTGWYGSVSALAAPLAPPREGMVVKNAAGTVWLVVDGSRRPVSSSVAAALGLPAARLLPDAVLSALPAGPGWTDGSRHPDGAVVTSPDGAWRLESGVRRPFTSPASRSSWSRSAVVVAALPGDLALPLGAPLAPPEGVVLRTATGGAVVSGGTLRPVSAGYPIDTAPLATAADLAALPAGAVVEAGRHAPGTLLKSGTTYYEVLGTTRRLVDPALAASDPRVAVAAFAGEVAALTGARWLPPSGVAGRAADGTVRVVEAGRLVTLAPSVAASLGYAGAALPTLAAADFGPLPLSSSLANAAAHPAGTVVTDGTAFWLLDASARRPLAASLVPTWLGRPALPATAADLALPVGAVAPPATGAWVATPDGARWLVDGGYRHAVSATVAHRLGLDQVQPVPVPSADLTAATKSGTATP